jgi:DNA invertase Pin-like site-specific DNA recombinase
MYTAVPIVVITPLAHPSHSEKYNPGSSVGRLVLAIMAGIAQSEKKKIAERYGSGESMPELARDYEIGTSTIQRGHSRQIELKGARLHSHPQGGNAGKWN